MNIFNDLSNGWKNCNYLQISKSFKFDNFNHALDFTNKVAIFAKGLDHYPEITLSNIEVKILLPKGEELGEVDFLLVKEIDQLKMDKESQEIAKNIDILKNSNDYERRKAVGRLGNIGDIRAVNPLIKSLKDKDPFVRRLSASSLGKIRSSKAVSSLG